MPVGIYAYFELTDRAEPEDTIIKFEQMFLRRAEKGQCFHRPYLGCREFAASFAPIGDGESLPEPITEPVELGWMLNDLDYTGESPTPHFFRAKLEGGRVNVPPLESREVRA